MTACNISITTTADGIESRVIKKGVWIDSSATFVHLGYEEDQARVRMKIGKDGVEICREGDYSLHLTLKQGELLVGSLGIGGSQGEVSTKTERLEYILKENTVLLLTHYDLIVGGEAQKMKIRLKAERI